VLVKRGGGVGVRRGFGLRLGFHALFDCRQHLLGVVKITAPHGGDALLGSLNNAAGGGFGDEDKIARRGLGGFVAVVHGKYR
jgi:hypothetical protein